MSADHDYSTFSMSKNPFNKDSEKHNNSDDSSSDIQSTSLVLVQEQSVEPSQNGNHAPPKTRYIHQLTLRGKFSIQNFSMKRNDLTPVVCFRLYYTNSLVNATFGSKESRVIHVK